MIEPLEEGAGGATDHASAGNERACRRGREDHGAGKIEHRTGEGVAREGGDAGDARTVGEEEGVVDPADTAAGERREEPAAEA